MKKSLNILVWKFDKFKDQRRIHTPLNNGTVKYTLNSLRKEIKKEEITMMSENSETFLIKHDRGIHQKKENITKHGKTINKMRSKSNL